MKGWQLGIAVTGILGLVVSPFIVDARVSVRGYTRKDGTYVAPHYRSDPDGSIYNNYSYPGNYNPNTGSITPGGTSNLPSYSFDSSYWSDYEKQRKESNRKFYESLRNLSTTPTAYDTWYQNYLKEQAPINTQGIVAGIKNENRSIPNSEVPNVVSRIFWEVYGRKIVPSESTYWKNRARTDKRTEALLRGTMEWHKMKGINH